MIIKDKSLIKEVVKQCQIEDSVTTGTPARGRDSFFEQAGMALAVYAKAQDNQQEMIMIGMMTTPEKREILSMKREVMMAKMRAEKRKFDIIENADDVPSCVIVSNNHTTDVPTVLERTITHSSSSTSDDDDIVFEA